MSAPRPASRHDAYRSGFCVDCRVTQRVDGQARCAGCHARPPQDRHDAYRRGLCIDCLVAAHSAGRPRCGPCHAVHCAGPQERKRNRAGAA